MNICSYSNKFKYTTILIENDRRVKYSVGFSGSRHCDRNRTPEEDNHGRVWAGPTRLLRELDVNTFVLPYLVSI